MPDTTLGVLTKPQLGLPGSIRSGEYPRKNGTPVRSRIGRTSSSVVPGYVVDSRTTRAPADSRPATV